LFQICVICRKFNSSFLNFKSAYFKDREIAENVKKKAGKFGKMQLF